MIVASLSRGGGKKTVSVESRDPLLHPPFFPFGRRQTKTEREELVPLIFIVAKISRIAAYRGQSRRFSR